MPTLYDNFERVRQYIDQHQGGGDMSAYVTKDELSAQSYATASDLNAYLPLEGGTITGRLVSTYYTTSSAIGGIDSYSSVIVGGDDRNSVTMVATRRLCGDTSYAAAFFTNSDGRSKFTHKTKTGQYALGGSDDAFMCFNAYGFKIAYSGEQGVGATTEYEILHEGNIGNLGYITMGDVSACGYITSIPSTYASYNGVYSYLYDTLGISHGGSQGVAYIEYPELHDAELNGVTLINGINTDQLPTYAAISAMGYLFAPTVSGYTGAMRLYNDGFLEVTNTGNLRAKSFSYNQLNVWNAYTLINRDSLKNYINGRLAEIEASYVTSTTLENAGYVSAVSEGNFDSVVNLEGASKIAAEDGLTIDTGWDFIYLNNQTFADDTLHSSNIIPQVTNTYTLGDSNNYYNAAYSYNYYFYGNHALKSNSTQSFLINIAGNDRYAFNNGAFMPVATNRSLGQSNTNNKWLSTYTTNLYTDTAYLQDTSYTKSIVPAEAGTYTLGTADSYYNYLHVNQIKSPSGLWFDTSGNHRLFVSGTAMRPFNNNYDLGTSDIKYRSTYTSNIYADNAYISNYNNFIWTGTSAEYAALDNYTSYQIYLIQEA